MVLLASIQATVVGVEVQTWTHDTQTDFEPAMLDGVVVSSDGSVELGRQLSALANLEVGHVWSMARQPDGAILAGTGSPGRVIRILADGQVQSLHESRDQQIFALAVAPDGSIYYGSSPSGEVFRYSPAGEVSAVFETEETYIWGLTIDAAGTLLVATGPKGRLYRVDAQGKGEIFFEAKQQHLLSMVRGKDGSVYLGTSTDGLIYRVDAEGKGFVLYDAPQADVQTLLLDDAGNLYAGTGTPDRPNFPMPSARLWSPTRAIAGLTLSAFFAPPLVPVADNPAPAPAPGPAPRSAPRSNVAGAGENSVFRIAVDGQVDEVFREKCLVLSLGLQEGRLLIGTGLEGRLYAVDPQTRIRQSLARLASGQVQAMLALPDGGIVLGTGTPGQLWRVDPRYAAKGVMESVVLDAKLQARWGQGSSSAQIPPGSRLLLEYRSGNVEKPDETWSAWSTDARTLPLSRFLQYRATIESTEGRESPKLRSHSLYYSTLNKPPLIDTVDVPQLARAPIADGANKIEIKWSASDPNGDRLVYDLEVRKEDWPDWVSIAKEVSETSFKWDPAAFPSGTYRFRVSASDAPSNRQGEKTSSVKESEPFALDRESPAVTIVSVKQIGRKLEIGTVGKDDQTRLVAAGYSLDGIDWWPLFPDDGLFDASEEGITFQTGELPPNTYLVLVRYRDSAGHSGVADKVVRVEPLAPSSP
jgi:hypothetical protein